MKTKKIDTGWIYRMLMLCASKIDESGHRAYKATSDKYDILVTIRVKEKQNDSSQHI